MIAGEIDWKEVAAALKTSRSAKSVQNAALRMGLRLPVERKRRGGNWDAQRGKQGDKNTSRPPAAALTSPAASPPEQPRPSRAAAAAGDQQRQQTEQIVSGFDEQQLAATGLMSERSKREGWAHYYVSNLGAPPEEDWDGQGGTASVIAQHFDVPKGSRGSVRSVLEDVTLCIEEQREYCGSRKQVPRARALISTEGFEAEMIAEYMEDDYGLAQTTAMVNVWRAKQEPPLQPAGVSAVYSCYLAMEPVETAVEDIQQGKSDPNKPWSIARYNWITFLGVAFGELTDADLRERWPLPSPGPPHWACPKWSPREVHGGEDWPTEAGFVTPISKNQVAFFDGVHKKVVYGSTAHSAQGSRREVRFWRSADGRRVPAGTSGATLRGPKMQMSVKYSEESRFLYGGAVLEFDDGRTEARVFAPLVYDGCWMTSISEFSGEVGGVGGKRGALIKAVKESGSEAAWVSGKRKPRGSGRVLYETDPVEELLGTTKCSAELRALGFATVGDVGVMQEFDGETDKFQELANQAPGLGRPSVAKMVARAKDALLGDPPPVVDHRLHANPYFSRDGADWEAKIDADLRKKGSVCITEQVEHIITVCTEAFKGTVHEEDWLFYHDALVQMTDKKCQEWMETKGWLKRWLLPQHGCNDGTAYANRPVGDTPEVMPWDCHLNKDVDDFVAYHVAVTHHLPSTGFDDDGNPDPNGKEPDPRKFSRATPKQQTHAYLRVLETVTPLPARLIEDRDNCWGRHLRQIWDVRGVRVPGIGNRNGRRAVESVDRETERRGGHRVKGAAEAARPLHPQAKAAQAERQAAVEQRHKNKPKKKKRRR